MNKIRGNVVGTTQRPEAVLARATNLTEEQKSRARENIGAASADECVKNTDYATADKAGVVKVGTGLSVSTDNKLQIQYASQKDIENKLGYRNPLVPQFVDDIVKAGITTNGIVLTDEEKQAAKDWLGVTEGGGSDKPLELIRTVTIPGDIATDTSGVIWTQSTTDPTKPCKWRVSTDKNGEPFEIKYLVIVYKSQNAAATNNAPFLEIRNNLSAFSACSAPGLGISTAERRGGITVWDGKIRIHSNLEALWVEPKLQIAALTSQPVATPGLANVTSIYLYFNTKEPYWAEGATFDIYGVRV